MDFEQNVKQKTVSKQDEPVIEGEINFRRLQDDNQARINELNASIAKDRNEIEQQKKADDEYGKNKSEQREKADKLKSELVDVQKNRDTVEKNYVENVNKTQRDFVAKIPQKTCYQFHRVEMDKIGGRLDAKNSATGEVEHVEFSVGKHYKINKNVLNNDNVNREKKEGRIQTIVLNKKNHQILAELRGNRRKGHEDSEWMRAVKERITDVQDWWLRFEMTKQPLSVEELQEQRKSMRDCYYNLKLACVKYEANRNVWNKSWFGDRLKLVRQAWEVAQAEVYLLDDFFEKCLEPDAVRYEETEKSATKEMQDELDRLTEEYNEKKASLEADYKDKSDDLVKLEASITASEKKHNALGGELKKLKDDIENKKQELEELEHQREIHAWEEKHYNDKLKQHRESLKLEEESRKAIPGRLSKMLCTEEKDPYGIKELKGDQKKEDYDKLKKSLTGNQKIVYDSKALLMLSNLEYLDKIFHVNRQKFDYKVIYREKGNTCIIESIEALPLTDQAGSVMQIRGINPESLTDAARNKSDSLDLLVKTPEERNKLRAIVEEERFLRKELEEEDKSDSEIRFLKERLRQLNAECKKTYNHTAEEIDRDIVESVNNKIKAELYSAGKKLIERQIGVGSNLNTDELGIMDFDLVKSLSLLKKEPEFRDALLGMGSRHFLREEMKSVFDNIDRYVKAPITNRGFIENRYQRKTVNESDLDGMIARNEINIVRMYLDNTQGKIKIYRC